MSFIKREASSSPTSENEGTRRPESTTAPTYHNNRSPPPSQRFRQDNPQSIYPSFVNTDQQTANDDLHQDMRMAGLALRQLQQPHTMQILDPQYPQLGQYMPLQIPQQYQAPLPPPQQPNTWENHPALINQPRLQELAALAPANLTPDRYREVYLQSATGGIHPSLLANGGRTTMYRPILPYMGVYSDLEVALRPQQPPPPQAPPQQQQRQRAPPIRRERGTVQCVACREEFDAGQTIQTLCQPSPHHYCHACYKAWLTSAIGSKTLCICCGITSPFDLSRSYFTAPLADPDPDTNIARDYRSLVEETSTPNPQYCGDDGCKHFIHPRNVHPENGYRLCMVCKKKTCTRCNKLLQDHLGNRNEVCPADAASEELEVESARLAEAFPGETLRRCPRCFAAYFRHPDGCNQLQCPLCGQRFCFACGEARVPSVLCACRRPATGTEGR